MKGEHIMNMEKSMIINCEICDTRKMRENAYEKYDKIILNAELVIVNERSKELLEKPDIICNAEEFIEIGDDCDNPIVSTDGGYTIGRTVPAEDNIILCVNGGLTVNPGAEEALKHYCIISVNGGVLCPESMAAHLSRMRINGSTTIYPDEYTLLKNAFVIDKYFPLRAADNGKYFVPGTVKLIDKEVNAALLVEKNVRFKAKKLLIVEEKIGEAAVLFDENTEFIVVPLGFSVVEGNVTLNEDLIKKYGDKIFVYGNLDARGDIAGIASHIDALVITGKVTLTKKSAEEFKKLNAEYKKTDIVKEVVWRNKAAVKLNNDSISLSEDGISIINCGAVTIDKGIAPESIVRLVDMKNIGTVVCSEEQTAAVETVGVNIGGITNKPVRGMMSALGESMRNKVVNTEKYVM